MIAMAQKHPSHGWNEHYRSQDDASLPFFRKAISLAIKNFELLRLQDIKPFIDFQKEELERLKMHGDKVGMAKVAKDILRAYEAMYLEALGEQIKAEMKALGVEL